MKSNIVIILIIFIAFVLTSSCEDKNPTDSLVDITELQGSYLGQSPPGITPEIFAPDIVSTENREAFLVTMPGGNELYYAIITGGGNAAFTEIIELKIEGDTWSSPEVAPFSSNYLDGYFGIHPDGSRFYFQSDRPVDASESIFTYNIWYMDRTGDAWGEPEPIGRPINGRNHVSGPSATTDGTLYFTLMTIGGPQELYRSKYIDGEYQAPERLPDHVNSATQQFDSYIAPDESYLLFNTSLTDTYGGIDLYVCFRDSLDHWSSPINLGAAINTANNESSATISPDGKYIFYGRMNGDNDLDVYWVESEYLESLR